MHPQLRGRAAASAVALVLVLAAWNNVIVIHLPGYPGSYLAGNVVATGMLLAAARAGGLSWQELGLARSRLPAGARWGLVCVALVALAYAAALAVPPARPLLVDERVAGLDDAELAYDVLVRIPLGTVVWEERAFPACCSRSSRASCRCARPSRSAQPSSASGTCAPPSVQS